MVVLFVPFMGEAPTVGRESELADNFFAGYGELWFSPPASVTWFNLKFLGSNAARHCVAHDLGLQGLAQNSCS